MDKKRKVLLASHEETIGEVVRDIFEEAGFKVDCAWDVTEVLDKVGDPESPKVYDIVVMDANLGNGARMNYSPVERVHEVTNGRTDLYSITGLPGLKDELKRRGLPVVYKPEMSGYFRQYVIPKYK
jgi:CheY-like chemotaxis protein